MIITPAKRSFLIIVFVVLFLAPATVRAQFGEFTFFEPGDFVFGGPSKSKLEAEFFELINQTRIERGLKPLQWSDEVAVIAREHSNNMAFNNFFGHRDREGRAVDARADEQGLKKWRMIGENVAYCNGYSDPVETTVSAWLESAGHRKNIMRKKWRETGIGVAFGENGKMYVTQVFLKRK